MRPLVGLSYAGIVAVEAACALGAPVPPALQMLLLALFTLHIGCSGHLATPSEVRLRQGGERD